MSYEDLVDAFIVTDRSGGQTTSMPRPTGTSSLLQWRELITAK